MISINLLSSFLFPHWQYNINFKMTFIQISRNSIKMHMYDTCDLHLPLMTSLYFSWHHCLTAYRATALTHSKQIDHLRKWSQSCSVVSNSLQPDGLYNPSGFLQARILEWVAFPFSRGSFQPGDQTQVSRNAGGFFNSWAIREAHFLFFSFFFLPNFFLIILSK